MCADAEAVNLVSLLVETDDCLLVNVVTCNDGKVLEPGKIKPATLCYSYEAVSRCSLDWQQGYFYGGDAETPHERIKLI